jgi:hypothetical protein
VQVLRGAEVLDAIDVEKPVRTTAELLMNGVVAGRLPSGLTGPRNVSEKMNSSRPPGSVAV